MGKFSHSLAQKFNREVIDDSIPTLLDDATDWMKTNLEPHDVFDHDALAKWAEQNDYTLEGK